MTNKERLEELINRKPSRWGNLTIYEFERDIKILQKQAERARELEESEREWVLYQTEVHGLTQSLEQQNKRYREAIEKAIKDLENECLWDALEKLKALEEGE